MFKFRLLLFFVGVIALLLLTPATYSQGYGYSPPMYPSYGYGYAAPSYPAYGSYGSYGKPSYGSGYSESCNYMKVIEVLDQIFCTHIDKRRYSSTIYPYIEVIIDQIEYTKEYVCIPSVYDYLTAAQHELETLQDAVYALYSDSSLLKEYYEYSYDGCDGCATQQSTTGTQGSGAQSTRTNAQAVTKGNQQKVDTFKENSKIFMTQRQANLQSTSSGTSSFSKLAAQRGQNINSKTDEVILIDVKQRAKVAEINVANGNVKEDKSADAIAVVDVLSGTSDTHSHGHGVLGNVLTINKREGLLKKRLASTLSAREPGQRKTRGAEYTDYTCTYLPYAYCDEEYYDELLYNILTRLWTALDFIWLAGAETWWFISELDCSSWEDRCALIEASIMYGAMGTEFYYLVEIADYVERMYELIELDYGGDEYYGRAMGGSNDTYIPSLPSYTPTYSIPPPQPVYQSPMKKPVPQYVPASSSYSPYPGNKPPAPLAYPYPFSSYIPTYNPPQQQPSPSPQPYSPYQPPQLYRQQRAASTASLVPSVFLVG